MIPESPLPSPDSPAALNNLAWILAASAEATIRSGTEAVPLAKRACDLTLGREPLYLGTLAAAYAEAGQFGDSVSTAEQAIAVAENIGQRDLAKANRDHRLLFLRRQSRYSNFTGID